MIPISNPALLLDEEMKSRALKVLQSGRYILGEETKGLEKEFSSYCGCRYGIAVSSGTTALQLGLLALGIKPRDEVITTTHSFIATANSIVHAGGRPVLVDIEPDTHNIDPSKIEKAVTKKTKAIVPVHIYGHPCDMDPIMEIAERHGLMVLEDACQAHGARYKKKKVGSIGDAAAFSFFPSKVMTVFGDGGIVVTDDPKVAGRASMLRNQGRAEGKKYEHDAIGYNFRISEIAAAMGRLGIKHIDEWVCSREAVRLSYDSMLDGTVKIPAVKSYAKSSNYVYTIMTEKRDALHDYLRKKDVECNIYYPIPIHMQPAYRSYRFRPLPVAERVASKILSLPMHPFLKKEEIEYVAETVKSFCKKA